MQKHLWNAWKNKKNIKENNMSIPEQNTQEWLEWRKNKIGASDAPIVMGKSPWKTPHELYEEKIGLKNDFRETTAMARGKALEPYALESFCNHIGVVLAPKVFVHPKHEYIIASIDGVSADGKTAVEIKCPGVRTHVLAMEGKISDHYQIQMQHQMEVLGLDSIYYYSYDGDDGVVLTLNRDQNLINDMLQAEHEFYECIKSKTPPEDKRFRLDEEWVKWSCLWKELQEEKKRLEAKEKECRENLIELSDGSSYGNGIYVSQIEKKGSVDYSKIPVLKTIDLEKYRKESSKYWKIGARR